MFNDKTPNYWLEIAKHDIEASKILIEKKSYPDVIIYHLHQATEKILKAKILDNNGQIEYIHDLERLYKILIKLNDSYSKIENEIIILQSYYTDFRYPKSEFLNKKDLLKAIKLFEKIKKNLLY